MGFIRRGLLVIVGVLFLVSLLMGNSLLTISKSLEYENVQKELTPVISDVLESEFQVSEIIEEKIPAIEEYCENNPNFVFSDDGETFEISCDSVNKGSKEIIDNAIENFVEDIYYEDYSCEFIDCIEKNPEKPFFLVSEQTKEYLKNKFYFLLLASIILGVLMFFLIKDKTNFPILSGSLIILSALPFLKIASAIFKFSNNFIVKIIAFFFSESFSVALKVLIIGAVFLASGIFLKFFKLGFKINEFLDKIKNKNPFGKIVKKSVKEKSSKSSKSK